MMYYKGRVMITVLIITSIGFASPLRLHLKLPVDGDATFALNTDEARALMLNSLSWAWVPRVWADQKVVVPEPKPWSRVRLRPAHH